MTLNISEEVSAAWRRMLDDNTDINWVTAGYPEGSNNELVLLGEGTGGIAEFRAQLGDQIIYGGFRCTGVDDRGNTVSRRGKIIFVNYLPTSVPTMRRARAGGHKGQVKSTFVSAHVDIQIEDPSELSEDDIIARLRAAGGAHQPTHYEF